MKVCIIGNCGNMGRRYSAILNNLNVDFCGVDINETIPKTSHYIIATPTKAHLESIPLCENAETILCEKPIAKRNTFPLWFPDNVRMVCNWAFLGKPQYTPGQNTVIYNYFRTGADGFWWDLIQPLYLATTITASNTSPVFECVINDRAYTQRDFDFSYIRMIEAWLKDPTTLWGKKEIIESHNKAWRYQNDLGNNSGQVNIEAITQ